MKRYLNVGSLSYSPEDLFALRSNHAASRVTAAVIQVVTKHSSAPTNCRSFLCWARLSLYFTICLGCGDRLSVLPCNNGSKQGGMMAGAGISQDQSNQLFYFLLKAQLQNERSRILHESICWIVWNLQVSRYYTTVWSLLTGDYFINPLGEYIQRAQLFNQPSLPKKCWHRTFASNIYVKVVRFLCFNFMLGQTIQTGGKRQEV